MGAEFATPAADGLLSFLPKILLIAPPTRGAAMASPIPPIEKPPKLLFQLRRLFVATAIDYGF
jgi:hypothetical protein